MTGISKSRRAALAKLFMHLVAGINGNGTINDSPGHVMDLLQTLQELAGAIQNP